MNEGRCCLKASYDPTPYTWPTATPEWPDPNPEDAFWTIQDGGASVNLYNSAFYEMVK